MTQAEQRFWAHPACYWCLSLDIFVKNLVKLGLDGVEAFYPYKRHRGIIKFHLASTVKKVGEKYNLILTGGSDSHGRNLFLITFCHASHRVDLYRRHLNHHNNRIHTICSCSIFVSYFPFLIFQILIFVIFACHRHVLRL